MGLALDATGTRMDWPLRLVTGIDHVAAKIRTRLLTLRGEAILDQRIGTDLLRIVRGMTDEQLDAEIRAQLRLVSEVEQVRAVVIRRAGEAVTYTAEVLIRTAEDGLAVLTLGEPLPCDTRGAPAWYTVSGDLRHGRGPHWQGA